MAKQWFQKLGFKDYPLDPRSNPNLVGVDDIEHRLVSFIEQGNMCLLCGLTGSGKTSMLQKIMQRSDLKKYQFFFISADGIKRDRDIDDLVRERMSIFQRMLFKKPKNIVILLDECQVASRILTESIKSKWNEIKGNDKIIQSVIVSQIPTRLNSNFSGSFMDRLGKRVVKMRKLKASELKAVLEVRLTKGKKAAMSKFTPTAIDFLVANCDGSVRQLLEYTDNVFREVDRLDPKALLDPKFKISKENVFTILQTAGAVVDKQSEVAFEKVLNNKRLREAVEMFENFGVMDPVLLAEKLDVSKATATRVIKDLSKEDAIMISHTEDKSKFYVLTPRIKHELVKA